MIKLQELINNINKLSDEVVIEPTQVITLDEHGNEHDPFFYPCFFPPEKPITIRALKYYLGLDVDIEKNSLPEYLVDYQITDDEIKFVFAGSTLIMGKSTRITETIVYKIKKEVRDEDN
jgi:hypothetical protein